MESAGLAPRSRVLVKQGGPPPDGAVERRGIRKVSSTTPSTKFVQTHAHSVPASSEMVATGKPEAVGMASTTLTPSTSCRALTHAISEATAIGPPT